MLCGIYVAAAILYILIFIGALPQIKNEWNKWKNHFCKMKGDVGMSHHENKNMPTPRQRVIHNPIRTSFFFFLTKAVYACIYRLHAHAFVTSKRLKYKDVGMGL